VRSAFNNWRFDGEGQVDGIRQLLVIPPTASGACKECPIAILNVDHICATQLAVFATAKPLDKLT
jgi:hypothetical protein